MLSFATLVARLRTDTDTYVRTFDILMAVLDNIEINANTRIQIFYGKTTKQNIGILNRPSYNAEKSNE